MMLATIYLCNEVVDNVCNNFISLNELFTLEDASAILSATLIVWALAFVFRLMMKLFD